MASGPSSGSARRTAAGADGGARTERVFEGICAQVRTELTLGRLKPGDKLPAERDLALRLGSSRTAVREALRTLEMAGVIELRKGVKGGAFIREGDPAVVTRSFGDMVHLGRISLADLTEGRVIIQDAVVRLACERATEADFRALAQVEVPGGVLVGAAVGGGDDEVVAPHAVEQRDDARLAALAADRLEQQRRGELGAAHVAGVDEMALAPAGAAIEPEVIADPAGAAVDQLAHR